MTIKVNRYYSIKLFKQVVLISILGATFFLSKTAYTETPSADEILQLENQIEQQEAAQEKAKQRAAEEARRREEEQKLREERARLEEERRILDEEKLKIESARQADIDRQLKEEKARQLALEEQKRKEEEALNAMVTLVFYRNQSFPFDGDSAIISHTGNEIGRLSSKSYFIYRSPPDDQKFKAVIFGGWTVERGFDFQPGSVNFLMTAIDWTTVDITKETVGPEAINGLENTGSLEPGEFFSNIDEVMDNSGDSSTATGVIQLGR